MALGALVDDITTYVDTMGRSNGGNHDNLTLAIIETKFNSKLRPTMSKQTKITLILLATICAISIVCNIWQAIGTGKNNSTPVSLDSTEIIANREKIKQQAIHIKDIELKLDSLMKEQKTIKK